MHSILFFHKTIPHNTSNGMFWMKLYIYVEHFVHFYKAINFMYKLEAYKGQYNNKIKLKGSLTINTLYNNWMSIKEYYELNILINYFICWL